MSHDAPATSGSTGQAERVFFVRRLDVARGDYPYAEPVVLVDAALMHRFIAVRELEVIDPPARPDLAPSLAVAHPIFVIDQREGPLYDNARPAAIVFDRRSTRSERVSAFSTLQSRIDLPPTA